LGSSDLWSRSSVSNIDVSDSSASSSFTSATSSSPGVAVAVKEAGLEPVQKEYYLMELKLDNLSREVSNLKSALALLVGLIIGVQIGGEKSLF